MKFNRMKFFTLTALLMIACLALFALPAHAQPGVTPTRTGDGIAGPLLMSGATTNLTAAQKIRIPVHQGKGLAIVPVAVGLGSTNTGVSGLFFSVATDAAGTNFSTTTPIVKTFSGNGTTAVRDYIPIAATDLVGATAIQLRTVTNAAVNVPGLIISNINYSIPW